jgi:RNA polymerase sigma factor (sigma-70 family)
MNEGQDQQRFEALLSEHRKIIFKLVATFARDVEDRKDLAQEVIVQLWRSFGQYDERRAKFSTWLYRIALNVAISQVRRERRSVASRAEPLEEHHLERIASVEPDRDDDERVVELWAFIDQLDALNRALMLLYLEDRSYAEIGEILGISETNVATKINRIKQKLRRSVVAAEIKGEA